jgi:hypothetical protein
VDVPNPLAPAGIQIQVRSLVALAIIGKWAKMPHHQLLRKFSPGKLHILCSQKVFQWCVWVCASHSCRLVLKALTLLCKVNNVIFNILFFRELLFNNVLFVYANNNLTNRLRERRVGYSVLFYTVTNFRKPCHSHVIRWEIFAPRLGTVAPLKHGERCPPDSLTRLVDLCSYIELCTVRTYCNIFYLHLLRVKERIKTARLHSCIGPFLNTHPGFSGKNANRNYQTQGHQGQGEVSMESSH